MFYYPAPWYLLRNAPRYLPQRSFRPSPLVFGRRYH